jgi:hypothetical protein
MSEDDQAFWRDMFASTKALKDIRTELYQRLDIAFLYDDQLEIFKRWEKEYQTRVEEVARQRLDQRLGLAPLPQSDPAAAREAILNKAYARALATGDFDLGLKTVRIHVNVDGAALDREKFELKATETAAKSATQPKSAQPGKTRQSDSTTNDMSVVEQMRELRRDLFGSLPKDNPQTTPTPPAPPSPPISTTHSTPSPEPTPVTAAAKASANPGTKIKPSMPATPLAAVQAWPERPKQDGGHAERGFLGAGEASAKEQVQSDPVTEPKRSQNPKGPLPSSPQPDGHRLALDALNLVSAWIALTDATREKWQLVEDSWFKPLLQPPAKANFADCWDNTRQLLRETTALRDQLQPLTTGADRSAAAPWLAIVAVLGRMLDALTSMNAQFPRVIFSKRVPVPMMRKDVADAKVAIIAHLKQLREAAHEARDLLKQHLAKLAPVTPPTPAANSTAAPVVPAAANLTPAPKPDAPPVQSLVCLSAPPPGPPPTAAAAIPVIIADITPQDVTPPPKNPAPGKANAAALQFRPHQMRIFEDRRGILILHWARQLGKSYVLAAWAVDRLMDKLCAHDTWLVTVLSNSRENGAEFVLKCQDDCNRLGLLMQASDHSPDLTYENMCLLTHELIQQAMREGLPIAAQTWSPALRERLRQATGELFLGQDVGRHHDLSVQVVLERQGNQLRVLAILRMAGLRLPDQQTQLATVCMLPKFRRACLDMTGLGLGLVEYAQQEPWGRTRIVGINFASTEPVNDFIRAEGRPAETARVTENMATALLKVFEDKTITFAVALDREAMEDLRKPERITTPGGRTSIAAVRDEAGHADLFWALALAVRSAESRRVPVAYAAVTGLLTQDNIGNLGLGPMTGKFIL